MCSVTYLKRQVTEVLCNSALYKIAEIPCQFFIEVISYLYQEDRVVTYKSVYKGLFK